MTATAPSAQESASDGTPEWALDSGGHAVLAPGYVDPGSGGSNGDPAVASWALSHYKISYNGFGDDCTDFVSRVLFYGGWLPEAAALADRMWLERVPEQAEWEGETDPERLVRAFTALCVWGRYHRPGELHLLP